MDAQRENFSPLDCEAEQALLGALIAYPEAIDKASHIIAPENFFDQLHQRMCAEIFRLHGDGTAVSPLTLHLAMRNDEALNSLGNVRYPASLASAAPAVPNIISLAKAVKTQHVRRSLAVIGENLTFNSRDDSIPVKEQIELAEKALYSLAEKSQFGSRLMGFGQAVQIAIKQAENACKNAGKIVGVPTGFAEIDTLLGGLQNSDLLIIAGRPGMGKTALATNMAFHAATLGHPCLFFSLEMAAQQLSARILAEQSGVEMWKARAGNMRPAEWESYVLAGQKLDDLPLYIDDTGGISLPQLTSRARKSKREQKTSLIVIDYLQLMAGSRRDGNRVQEVTEITKGLKTLAKELDIPIIALSQLSRGVDSRDDKRPVLSDLRESGSIEQDADTVAFVYREEYYVKSREPDIADQLYSKWQEKMERCHGKADVLVEKHRHGETRRIQSGFDARFTRFHDLA